MREFVTFKKLGNYGRLGNQLWQYAALKGLSLRLGCEVGLLPLDHVWWHGQQCLLQKCFPLKYKPLNWHDLESVRSYYSEPDYMKYDKNFEHLKVYTDIVGFFQSTLYFKGFEEEIKKELTPKNEHMESAWAYIQDLKERHDCEIVSLHLRRGDNVDNSNPEQYKIFKKLYGDGKLDKNSIFFNYFQKAKDVFSGKNVKFLIFTGGTRSKGNSNFEDLKWAKENFNSEEFLFSNGDTIQDFCRMICSDHYIGSHVSSLNWWAMFLGEKPEKIVVAPKNYHFDRDDVEHREGFYPSSWILV